MTEERVGTVNLAESEPYASSEPSADGFWRVETRISSLVSLSSSDSQTWSVQVPFAASRPWLTTLNSTDAVAPALTRSGATISLTVRSGRGSVATRIVASSHEIGRAHV